MRHWTRFYPMDFSIFDHYLQDLTIISPTGSPGFVAWIQPFKEGEGAGLCQEEGARRGEGWEQTLPTALLSQCLRHLAQPCCVLISSHFPVNDHFYNWIDKIKPGSGNFIMYFILDMFSRKPHFWWDISRPRRQVKQRSQSQKDSR